MKPIKLPEEIAFISALLTFRCNYKCAYCITKQRHLKVRKEMKPEQWIEGLSRFDTKLPIVFDGGEPSQYDGWLKVVKDIVKRYQVDVLTNLSFDVDEFLSAMSNKFPFIKTSYHPGFSDIPKLLRKVKQIQDKKYFIRLYALDHPDMAGLTGEKMADYDPDFRLQEMLGEYKGRTYGNLRYPLTKRPRTVQCKTSQLLIAPDGNIHRCYRDLYAGENKLGNLLDKGLEIDVKFQGCVNGGHCNPQDIEMKNGKAEIK